MKSLNLGGGHIAVQLIISILFLTGCATYRCEPALTPLFDEERGIQTQPISKPNGAIISIECKEVLVCQ